MSSGGGFTAGALACPTTHDVVLEQAVIALQQSLNLTESTCIISDSEKPDPAVMDNVMCMVCPLDSTFDGQMPIGAGPYGIMEYSMVRVSVFTRLMKDRLEQGTQAYLDETRGLLPLKLAVLKALAGVQLYDPETNGQLLTEYSRPISYSQPPIGQFEDEWNMFRIVFTMPFYWNLQS